MNKSMEDKITDVELRLLDVAIMLDWAIWDWVKAKTAATYAE